MTGYGSSGAIQVADMNRDHSSILLQRARDGSTDAMNDVMDEVGTRLLGLIRLRMGPGLRGRVESRDILQNTLLKAFEHFEQFEGSGRSSLMGWMATIARNEIRDQADFHQRQKRDVGRQVAIEELGPMRQVAAHVRSEVSRIGLERDSQLLERALERVDESHREVILLRKFEELSFREIGERMGRTPEACRKLLARAMAAVSEEILALREEPHIPARD